VQGGNDVDMEAGEREVGRDFVSLADHDAAQRLPDRDGALNPGRDALPRQAIGRLEERCAAAFMEPYLTRCSYPSLPAVTMTVFSGTTVAPPGCALAGRPGVRTRVMLLAGQRDR
jgi:hypothetical protein